jgi:hypothetical protein
LPQLGGHFSFGPLRHKKNSPDFGPFVSRENSTELPPGENSAPISLPFALMSVGSFSRGDHFVPSYFRV